MSIPSISLNKSFAKCCRKATVSDAGYQEPMWQNAHTFSSCPGRIIPLKSLNLRYLTGGKETWQLRTRALGLASLQVKLPSEVPASLMSTGLSPSSTHYPTPC